MATNRIYIVGPKNQQAPGTARRLVEATHPANALRHVAADTMTVAVASQADLVALLKAGVEVETIKAEQTELPT